MMATATSGSVVPWRVVAKWTARRCSVYPSTQQLRPWEHRHSRSSSSTEEVPAVARRPPPPPRPQVLPPVKEARPPNTEANRPGLDQAPTQYLQMALHKDLRQAAAQRNGGKPDRVFETFWRYCNKFRADLADFDSCFNALVRCKAQGASVDGDNLLRLLVDFEAALRHSTAHPNSHYNRSLTSAAWSLARLARAHPPLPLRVLSRLPGIFTHMEEAARPLLAKGVFEPRNISMLAWSFSRAGAGSPRFFEDIGEAALQRFGQLSPRDFSNLALAFASTRVEHELLQRIPAALLERYDERFESFSEQDISNVVWAYATLQSRQAELFKAFARAVELRAHELPPRGVVNVTWAYAVQREDAPFARALCERLADDRWQHLDTQGAARLLWSLATLHYEEWMESYFVSLASCCIKGRASWFNAQDVSNSLWAFATVRVEHPETYQLLSARAVEIMESFNPQAIANVSWSCAKMQSHSPGFFNSVVDEVLRRPLRSWPPQSIATLCWSLAEVQEPRCAELLSIAVVPEMRARAEAFNDVDMSTMARLFKQDAGWLASANDLRRATLARISAEAKRRELPRTLEALDADPVGTEGDYLHDSDAHSVSSNIDDRRAN